MRRLFAPPPPGLDFPLCSVGIIMTSRAVFQVLRLKGNKACHVACMIVQIQNILARVSPVTKSSISLCFSLRWAAVQTQLLIHHWEICPPESALLVKMFVLRGALCVYPRAPALRSSPGWLGSIYHAASRSGAACGSPTPLAAAPCLLEVQHQGDEG